MLINYFLHRFSRGAKTLKLGLLKHLIKISELKEDEL
jgi:hypothetical protein